MPITKIILTTLSQSCTSIARTQIQREKVRTNDLTSFDNLPVSLEQKGEDFIQPTELQELQIDPKIQIRETTQFVVEFSQTN